MQTGPGCSRTAITEYSNVVVETARRSSVRYIRIRRYHGDRYDIQMVRAEVINVVSKDA